ncbi:dienelactone hydrolase family protein-like protein [Aulographum hederae CBS 113979]|uniref:Dienelactone hydrolase family protein-like protein n=1 Tax=Aulographum hederae CBS 113979 TaxID=1176131 RepID=A0A6G1HEX2_9PEZI|nr:dienelactone hydrolase family protein-like protein [Aulographum hederae CBS 113979]
MSQSKACCSVPPVVGSDYKDKGKYEQISGMKTYVTGPAKAKRSILVVYDIFGFFPQTTQGADILAYGDSEQPTRVFMPDFFDGKPADISWYPPDNDEKGKKLGEFFSTAAAPPKTLQRLKPFVDEVKKSQYDGTDSWGLLGYCWGGKIVNLASKGDTIFKAAAVCHPAMVDPSDAPDVTIPFAMLPSKDEDKNDVAKWEEGLKVTKKVEWFDDQIHGFMAARGDLSNESVKNEYERGYKILLDWFHDKL